MNKALKLGFFLFCYYKFLHFKIYLPFARHLAQV